MSTCVCICGEREHACVLCVCVCVCGGGGGSTRNSALYTPTNWLLSRLESMTRCSSLLPPSPRRVNVYIIINPHRLTFPPPFPPPPTPQPTRPLRCLSRRSNTKADTVGIAQWMMSRGVCEIFYRHPHARGHTRMHKRTPANTHARTDVRMHARIHTRTLTHTGRQASKPLQARTHALARTHVRLCTHARTHTPVSWMPIMTMRATQKKRMSCPVSSSAPG